MITPFNQAQEHAGLLRDPQLRANNRYPGK